MSYETTLTTESDNFQPTRFMAPDSHYSKEAADYVIAFIQQLKHTKGTFYNKPFILLPWQSDLIRNVFGVLKPNGYRQFNTVYLELGKKSGKTELAAAIALYLLCADGEQAAEIFSCAANRAQASLVFSVAADMVSLCPALNKRIKLLRSQKRMIYKPTNSFYQVLSAAEPTSFQGFNVHGVCYDELMAAPNPELFRVMTQSSGDARTQPLYFLTTTAGDDLHSICYEQHCKAVDILEGRKQDPRFYPVIYAAADDDDWTDPKVWAKANPSMGVTFPIEKVRAACESAIQNPAEENSFRMLRLSQWVKQSVRWMPMHKWDACAFPVDLDKLRGRKCYVGCDLSAVSDYTTLVLVFPPENGEERYFILPYFWIPEETLTQRIKRDGTPCDQWKKDGYLFTTDGNVVDYDAIRFFLNQLREKYNIREIACDTWNATQLIINLQDDGFTVVPIIQGMKSLSPPTKELMRLVLEQKIAHGGHPVLRWMMDNVVVRSDPAGNIKPDKERAKERIDGAVALIMGLDRAIRNGNTPTTSVYDNRGILLL